MGYLILLYFYHRFHVKILLIQKLLFHRDIYLRRISELESLTTALKEEQKNLDSSEATNLKQMKLWSDVVTLLESKLVAHRAAEAKKAAGGEYADVQQMEVDRLLL